MADIASLNTFSAGDVAQANELNENFYDPKSTAPTSFEAINGSLNEENLPGGDFVTSEMVRPNSMCRGEMTGSTGNLDYHAMLFPSDAYDSNSFAPIPGASKAFYLPIAPSVTIITWQITLGNTIVYAPEPTDPVSPRCILRTYLDGVKLAAQEREVPHAVDVFADYSTTVATHQPTDLSRSPFRHDLIRHKHRDRTWSGHTVRLSAADEGLSAGWHKCAGRLWTNEALTRVRVRNIKVVWFK